jgi:hypothetical protein
MKNKLTSLIAAIGLLCLAPGIASASYLEFDFNNTGGVVDTAPCGLGCYQVDTVGVAYETSGLPGSNSWLFTGSMKFLGGSAGLGSGPGLGWSFNDLSGNNDLWGSFYTTLSGNENSPVRTGSVSYFVEGGSGLFAGATGLGNSLITVSNWFVTLFTETGKMYVVTTGSPTTPSTNVPEPGMVSLLAAGLVMMGFVAYRRRREALQK